MFVRLQELTTVRTIRARTVESATYTRTATSAPATMVRRIHYRGVHCEGKVT